MDSRMKQSLDHWLTTEPNYDEDFEEGKSEFKPKRRTQSFFCVGQGGHESKGTPHTINNVGPFCTHCMTYTFQHNNS